MQTLQCGAKGQAIAIARIGDDQVDADAGGPHAADQGQREPPLFLKANAGGNPRFVTPLGGEPRLRQIQLGADQPRAHACPQRGRDGDLAIPNLAERAGVLPRHADRMRALFGEAGIVED